MHHPDSIHYVGFAEKMGLVLDDGEVKHFTNDIDQDSNNDSNSNSRKDTYNNSNEHGIINTEIRNNIRDDTLEQLREITDQNILVHRSHLTTERKEDFRDISSELFIPTSNTFREKRIPHSYSIQGMNFEALDDEEYESDYELLEHEESEEEWLDDFPHNLHDVPEFGGQKPFHEPIPEVVVAENYNPMSFDGEPPDLEDLLHEEDLYHGEHHQENHCADDNHNEDHHSEDNELDTTANYPLHYNEDEDKSIYGNHDDQESDDCLKVDCHRRHDDEKHHTCEQCDHQCMHQLENYLDGLSTTSTLDSYIRERPPSPTSTIYEFEQWEHLTATAIQISLKYSKIDWVLTGEVKQAECPINHRKKTQPVYWQVRVTLLPFKRQRFRTQYRPTSTPIFNETFEFVNIAKKALCQTSLRFRIYGRLSKYKRKHLAGECEVHLGALEHKVGNKVVSLQEVVNEWRILTRDGICEEDQSMKSNKSCQSVMSKGSIKSELSLQSEGRESCSGSSSCSSTSNEHDR